MRKITAELQNWLIVIFLCIHIVSVTLNLCLFDFCGHSINSFVALSSFGTYILILIITEILLLQLKIGKHRTAEKIGYKLGLMLQFPHE